MRLNYKEIGDGQPLVILHGLLGSLDNWQSIAKKLSEEFAVYTVDLRNHGKSPHDDEHSYLAMSEDLHQFFEEHHINKAHLIGHSMGGKTAMQFAIEHPDLVDKLIVVDIAPKSYDPQHDEIFEALLAMDISQIENRNDAEEMLGKRIKNQAVKQFLLKNLTRVQDNVFEWEMNLKGLSRNYDKINVAITSDHPVETATLIIRGGKSDYVQDDDLKSFKKIFPKAEMTTIDSAGHWVHAEADEEFVKTVRDFLS